MCDKERNKKGFFVLRDWFVFCFINGWKVGEFGFSLFMVEV